MPILKNPDAGGYVKDAVVLDLGDLARQAARLRMVAETQAAKIVKDAQREADALIDGAAEKGFAQGREAGSVKGVAEGRQEGLEQALAEGREQLQQLHTAWSEAAVQFEAKRRQMHTEAKEAVVRFSLELAEKIVHRVIEVEPAVVVDQVAAALTHVLGPLGVSVRINPEDRPWLERALPDLLARFSQLEHLHLVDDASVGRGGCVVSYRQGQIDASIDTQIERVVEMILPEEVRSQS